MSDRVWFTSDLHFGHSRVLGYSKRPFATVEEMDEALIANWNALVRPGDRVYVLGDVSLTRGAQGAERTAGLVGRLVGQKYLIRGNHDEGNNARVYPQHFVTVRDLDYIKVGSQKIALCHFALLTWRGMHQGSWMLHGHSHGSLQPDPTKRRADVGVDCWDFRPVSFEQIAEVMAAKTFASIDHHGSEDL
jgi:calcineurin-like phosphoesterase family protein